MAERNNSVSRRTVLGTTVAAAGVGRCGRHPDDRRAGFITAADAQTKAPAKATAHEVAPGQLDDIMSSSQRAVRRDAHHRSSVDARPCAFRFSIAAARPILGM
jgi:hypothetical protein